MSPTNNGLIAAPVVRATPVISELAQQESGLSVPDEVGPRCILFLGA